MRWRVLQRVKHILNDMARNCDWSVHAAIRLLRTQFKSRNYRTIRDRERDIRKIMGFGQASLEDAAGSNRHYNGDTEYNE